MASLFRAMLLIAAAGYSLVFATLWLPHLFFEEQVTEAIMHSGAEATVVFPMAVYWIFPAGWLSACIGMLFFAAWARVLFLLLLIWSALLTALSGMSILAGPQAATLYVVNILEGAILATAYFTGVAERFRRSGRIENRVTTH